MKASIKSASEQIAIYRAYTLKGIYIGLNIWEINKYYVINVYFYFPRFYYIFPQFQSSIRELGVCLIFITSVNLFSGIGKDLHVCQLFLSSSICVEFCCQTIGAYLGDSLVPAPIHFCYKSLKCKKSRKTSWNHPPKFNPQKSLVVSVYYSTFRDPLVLLLYMCLTTCIGSSI